MQRMSPVKVGLGAETSNVRHTFQRMPSIKIALPKRYDAKTVGLGEVVKKGELQTYHGPIEEHEAKVRVDSKSCWVVEFAITLISAVLAFVVYQP